MVNISQSNQLTMYHMLYDMEGDDDDENDDVSVRKGWSYAVI